MPFQLCLHLGTTILEPKLDLSSLKAKPFAKLQPLLFIRMRAFFEHSFKLLNLLGCVSVVSLFPWWKISSFLIISRSTFQIITPRSTLMLFFSASSPSSSSSSS
uniref:Uncharacterized protein n=1 Tax=Opuntia streptacantha TaxID=393608 RepID=A0A7C9AHT5_OPUST